MYESFSGILLDIDNTLYDYNDCHKKALQNVRQYCDNTLKIPADIFNNAYNESRRQINGTWQSAWFSNKRVGAVYSSTNPC